MTKKNSSNILNARAFTFPALLLWIICSCGVSKQSNIPEWRKGEFDKPAKVLYAEQVYASSGSLLQQFDLLKSDEMLTIRNGFLLLQHFSGKVFEYSGDTTLSVSDAINFTDEDELLRPYDLEFLFNDKRHDSYYRNPGVITDDFSTHQFLYPYERKSETRTNQDICLWWKPLPGQAGNEVTITIRDIFDDVLHTFETDERRLEVPIPANPVKNLLIVQLNQKEGGYHEVGLMITNDASIITPCNAEKSIDLLQVAIKLELDKHFEEAYGFYEKAADTQGHLIYQEIKAKAYLRIINTQ